MAQQRIVGGVILSLFLAAPGWTQTTSPSVMATPPQPAWSELTVPQKIILAPLADEWDSLESFNQKKWVGIAARFPSLSSEEQRRLQGQMQKWRKLTPEEQDLARENYKSARQLSTAKKEKLKQKWEEYSNLPEEEKEKLKKQATGRLNKPLLPILPTGKAGDPGPPHALPPSGKRDGADKYHPIRPIPRNLPPLGRFYWSP